MLDCAVADSRMREIMLQQIMLYCKTSHEIEITLSARTVGRNQSVIFLESTKRERERGYLSDDDGIKSATQRERTGDTLLIIVPDRLTIRFCHM